MSNEAEEKIMSWHILRYSSRNFLNEMKKSTLWYPNEIRTGYLPNTSHYEKSLKIRKNHNWNSGDFKTFQNLSSVSIHSRIYFHHL